MNSTLITLLALSLVAAAKPEKIFNGESLEGWEIKGAPYWKIVDGVLVGESDSEKKNSILWTEEEYADFVISFEFRYSGQIDSGVFVRQEQDQIQIGISGSLKRDMTASPYIVGKGYPVEAEGVAELLKEGEWNSMTVRAKGPEYTVSLNGKEVMTYESETAAEKGPIGLQVHPGLEMKVEFKDLMLEKIE